MTPHYLVDGDSVLQFSSKPAALAYLLSGKRVRAPVDSRHSHSGLNWAAPPASTGDSQVPEGQSSAEVRAP